MKNKLAVIGGDLRIAKLAISMLMMEMKYMYMD